MVYVNEEGYLERSTRSGRNSHGKGVKRDWWMIKHTSSPNLGHLNLENKIAIKVPNKYVGKRVRFKLEVVEDGSK